MDLPPLTRGRILKRYKRFLADVVLDDGRQVTAHCPNTGPMTGICQPNSLVQVSQSDNPKRKLAYTWEMIQIGTTWVGTNTAIPNRVVKLALQQQLLPELAARYTTVRTEVAYGQEGKSRIDFLLTGENEHAAIYVEVKSVTLSNQNLAGLDFGCSNNFFFAGHFLGHFFHCLRKLT